MKKEYKVAVHSLIASGKKLFLEGELAEPIEQNELKKLFKNSRFVMDIEGNVNDEGVLTDLKFLACSIVPKSKPEAKEEVEA